MKKVLVTGSSGFLGKKLCPVLASKGVEVTALTSKDCDLTDNSPLKKIPIKDYDHIFHLAAWTQAGDFCLHHSGEQWIINQQINTNVLAWWQKNVPTAKMIALGTSVSYSSENNLEESKYLQGIPNDKFFAYAMSKRMLLAGLQSLNKQFDMDYLYVVPSTLYGADYHLDGRQMHFIYDLVRKIFRGKELGENVVLWGDGYQRRELVYINDFINILLKLNKNIKNDIYNIGAGEDYSIRDFAMIICDELQYDFNKLIFDLNGYVGARSKILDIKKLNEHINIVRTPLKNGIIEIIEWVKLNRSFFLK